MARERIRQLLDKLMSLDSESFQRWNTKYNVDSLLSIFFFQIKNLHLGYDATLQKKELFICEEYCTLYLGILGTNTPMTPTINEGMHIITPHFITFTFHMYQYQFMISQSQSQSTTVLDVSVSLFALHHKWSAPHATCWGQKTTLITLSKCWLIPGPYVTMRSILTMQLQLNSGQLNAVCYPLFAWAKVACLCIMPSGKVLVTITTTLYMIG